VTGVLCRLEVRSGARSSVASVGAWGRLLVSWLVCLAAVGALWSSPAGASGLRSDGPAADPTRLAAQIDAESVRVGSLSSAFARAEQAARAADSAVTNTEAQLGADRQAVSAARGMLRSEAVVTYMLGDVDASGWSASGVGTGADAGSALLRRQYLEVAYGDLGDVVDRLHAAVADLQSSEVTLRTARAAAQETEARTARSRQAVLDAVAHEEAQLATARGSLAAQVVAAERAGGSPAPQGLPVAGGLQSAIGAQLGTAPPAPQAPHATPAPTASPGVPAVTPPGSTSPATTVALAPPPASSPVPGAGGGAGGPWAALRLCESGGNYAEDTGNGYYGAYQFSEATWSGLGYPGRPDQASPALQDQAAQRLQALAGWGQWPACSAALGLD